MKQQSCWGCGKDYLNFWTEDDLTSVMIEEKEELACSECWDEISENHDVDTGLAY